MKQNTVQMVSEKVLTDGTVSERVINTWDTAVSHDPEFFNCGPVKDGSCSRQHIQGTQHTINLQNF